MNKNYICNGCAKQCTITGDEYTPKGSEQICTKYSRMEYYETMRANTIRQANISRFAGILGTCAGIVLVLSTLSSMANDTSNPEYSHLGFAALLFLASGCASQSAKTLKKDAQRYHKKIRKLQRHR